MGWESLFWDGDFEVNRRRVITFPKVQDDKLLRVSRQRLVACAVRRAREASPRGIAVLSQSYALTSLSLLD